MVLQFITETFSLSGAVTVWIDYEAVKLSYKEISFSCFGFIS